MPHAAERGSLTSSSHAFGDLDRSTPYYSSYCKFVLYHNEAAHWTCSEMSNTLGRLKSHGNMSVFVYKPSASRCTVRRLNYISFSPGFLHW